MKRFIPFLRQLREDMATGEEPFYFTRINGHGATTRQGTKNQSVHPVMRRAIERARSNPNREVRVPDMQNPNNKEGILLGRLNDNESDYEFFRRFENETSRGYHETRNGQSTWVSNPSYREDDPRHSAMYGHYDIDANTPEWHDEMMDFTHQFDPRTYDQRTGASRAYMEAGRREQEEYEKRMDAWWNEGGPSANKELEQWKADAWRLSAEARKKQRELEQHYYNIELSMAGEVGDKRPKTNPYISPTERIMTAMRHAKKQAWTAVNNAQDIQRKREQAQKEREQRNLQAQRETEQRHREQERQLEQRRREQQRSKPIARPQGGREEPPLSDQKKLKV